MAIPVKFGDIGKSSKDLLKTDYSPFSLDINSQTVNGVKFTSSLKKSDSAKPEVTGDLKAKYVDAANGITFNYTFTTDRKLVAKIEASDVLTKGLRLDAEATIKAEAKSGVKVGLGYKQEHLNTNLSADVLSDKLPVSADAVIGYEGFNLGGEATYQVLKGAIQNFVLGASYTQADYAFAVHAKPEPGHVEIDTISASYFHQITGHIATSAQVSYKLSAPNAALVLGTQYTIDSTSSVKTVLDTNGKLLFQYTQKLRPNVKAIIGSTFQWTSGSVTADTGLSLTFDA